MKALNVIRLSGLIVVFVAASILTGFAKKPVTTNAPTTTVAVQNTIAQNLKFPAVDNKCDFQGTVDVIFVIDEGKLIVEMAESVNKELAKYVKGEMEKVCCKHIRGVTNQHFSIKLTYKLLGE